MGYRNTPGALLWKIDPLRFFRRAERFSVEQPRHVDHDVSVNDELSGISPAYIESVSLVGGTPLELVLQ